jgi:hypothetical protein
MAIKMIRKNKVSWVSMPVKTLIVIVFAIPVAALHTIQPNLQ